MAAMIHGPPTMPNSINSSAYPKSNLSSGSSSTSHSPTRPKLEIPHITFAASDLSPSLPLTEDSIYKPSKKYRTYSDVRRRGSSRLTLNEVPELEVLEPEPVWDDDDDEDEDIEKPGPGERRLGSPSPKPTGSNLAVLTEDEEGSELRRTTTAPAVARPMSLRRERLAPEGSGVAWPKIKRMGLGVRSKSYQCTSPGMN